jgi:hypothetical protein
MESTEERDIHQTIDKTFVGGVVACIEDKNQDTRAGCDTVRHMSDTKRP